MKATAGTSATATSPCPPPRSPPGTSASSSRNSSHPPATSSSRHPSSSPTANAPHYGLGTFVCDRNGHRELEHGGEVGGYVSENIVFPDDGIAIVVLTNQVASGAASTIGNGIARELLPAISSAAAADTFAPTLKTILTGLQQGKIDRSLFTPDTNDYFTPDTLADFKSTLAPLGAITNVTRGYTHQRGGMTGSGYRVTYSSGTTISVSVYTQPDGKIEQFLITGKS